MLWDSPERKLKANESELHKKMDELNIQLADAQKKYDIAKAELGKFPTKGEKYGREE